MYVYLIENKDNHIKIGKTKDIDKRLKELQTGNSKKLKLLAYFNNVPSCFENHLHTILNRYKIQGEWFNKEIINHIKNVEPLLKLITFVR